MLRDITIGQYYPSNSIIHKLDPRVKLFWTLIYIISLFLGQNILIYTIAGLFLFACIRASKVPVKFILRGLKAVFMLLMFSVIFNIFLTDGEVLFQIWKIRVTKEGIYIAAAMAVRLVFLIMGSSLMTLTTTPNDLTDGLEKSLGFLKVIRIPVHEISMMMSIALRFIPTLIEETQRIMKAQASRGVDLENGTIKEKISAILSLLVPLLVSAWDRAVQLADAMEARGYVPGKQRTRYKKLKMQSCDFALLFGGLLLLVMMIAMGAMGCV